MDIDKYWYMYVPVYMDIEKIKHREATQLSKGSLAYKQPNYNLVLAYVR